MLKHRIAEDLLVYRFPPMEGKHYGFSLYALLDPDSPDVLLIDTAYEEQSQQVLKDLEDRGKRVTQVVLSHYHPDHILGLDALGEVYVYGSPRCQETLGLYSKEDNAQRFAPSVEVDEEEAWTFGKRSLRFMLAPGHSPCSMYTLIDEAYVHVADNVMTSNEGQDILPWASWELIDAHIDSLQALRELSSRTFLLSHGIEIRDAVQAEAAIDNRITYFQNVLAGDGRLEFEDVVRGCSCDFLHKEWLIRQES